MIFNMAPAGKQLSGVLRGFAFVVLFTLAWKLTERAFVDCCRVESYEEPRTGFKQGPQFRTCGSGCRMYDVFGCRRCRNASSLQQC